MLVLVVPIARRILHAITDSAGLIPDKQQIQEVLRAAALIRNVVTIKHAQAMRDFVIAAGNAGVQILKVTDKTVTEVLQEITCATLT